MLATARIKARPFRVYQRADLPRIPQLQRLPADTLLAMRAVAAVLPFRVNQYVVEELIDWNNLPADPMFQLTFPQPGMLAEADLAKMMRLLADGADQPTIERAARQIQRRLNPHPAGQMELNVPYFDGQPLSGMQHKYRDTVLFFPSPGQTCHTYCTYCFRWPQFVGLDELKFASRQAESLVAYLKEHPEVSNVLFTGGDPLVMRTAVLRRYIEPLLSPELEHISAIRIGTKSPAWWPYRFVNEPDSDDLLRLFDQVRAAGRHMAIMAHYSRPRELQTPVAQAALRRIKSTGAIVRCQAPLIRHVNDDADTWADLWRLQVRLGAVPYYMFVERDTGPKGYFEVPLARCYEIFQKAYRRVSGLERTVRGPSMSATPGKVIIDGVTELQGEKVFSLRFVQAREPDWVRRPFFAKFDPEATWLDQLRPAFGEREFFFQRALREVKHSHQQPAFGHRIAPRRKLAVFGHVEWE
ncbi:KamA family radical SAM protein [Opitutus terrae]|uniref:Radical SAM domain protein n=1 Tax=Opitutus terrae (strain DSM 11246 / JCM 15787 / PB90-1) TaxID=452637 RepID=B1ZQZ6_OPITP|nr:lysine 2,3-aminomutase [Opitutus terrae]ACB73663.1 Radical SAM domain protein [Opitutus terrae PB90-1]